MKYSIRLLIASVLTFLSVNTTQAQGDFIKEGEKALLATAEFQKEEIEHGSSFGLAYSFNGKFDASVFIGDYRYDGLDLDESIFGIGLNYWLVKGEQFPINFGVFTAFESEQYDLGTGAEHSTAWQLEAGFITSMHFVINEKNYVHPFIRTAWEYGEQVFEDNSITDVTGSGGSTEIGSIIGFGLGANSSLFLKGSWVNGTSAGSNGIAFGFGYLQGI